MEDDDFETSSAGGLVPLALAILAIVLGGAGLYFGLTASQRLNPLSDSLEAGSSSTARLEKEISALDTQIAELSAQNAELDKALSRVRLYSNQSEQAVKQLVPNVQENRDQIVKLAGRVNELISNGVRPAPAATESSREEVPATTSTRTTPTPEESTATGTYTIQTGDTFAKIAAKLDVGLQALLDANPGADPRRLRIGQVINVPAN
ncbi:hypothetical protein DDZ13_11575 [Coraliomargarita sinensis]|uniref:LysM domain-containing protein n=1 Tax=Coraliomargarita sinensis TaxID=2174842 RepID=A0A317ZHA4_9BACT|nr:LysM peptidoglycan-binding domain-containing protein [Coraliomargarita sinensis]PXA03613.1 hypothetical protein DDZ13_11575 [Coraliomargarita sinensis]